MSSALVVDDDASSTEFMALVLRQECLEVRTAENGRAALLAIEDSLPDVVFSDIQMAEMTGIELLAQIKQRWHIEGIVVRPGDRSAGMVRKTLRIRYPVPSTRV